MVERSVVFRCVLTVSLFLAGGSAWGQDLQITDLSADGCRVVDPELGTGGLGGAIAVSLTHVFTTGDSVTGRFDLAELSADAGERYDALVSDLASGAVYSLGDGETPLSESGGRVTSLLEIDGSTGALTGQRIPLSMPIPAAGPTGIFAGLGRVVLATGGAAYDVALPSGTVRDLGAMPALPAFTCDNGAYWGVAEHFGGSIYLVYRRAHRPSIVRTRVGDGATTTVAAFSDLADMCSLAVSPSSGRWYFHHRRPSQFSRWHAVGSCDATLALSGSADLSLSTTDSSDPVAVDTSFFYHLTVTNQGPDDATGVRLTDRLPGTVDLVSAMPSQGACSLLCDAVVCELGELSAGAGAALTLEVIPRLKGTRINSATASGDQIDPDLSNNESFEDTEIDPASPGLQLFSISLRWLLRIDPSSGRTLARVDLTLPGASIDRGHGLATHPLTGELWGLLWLNGQAGTELVTIEPSGLARPIGNTGDRFVDLAFDDSGTLYGITVGWAETPEALFVLSQTDAQTSFVLSLADGDGDEAIAFALDGLLYHASGANTFNAIDVAGPTVTPIEVCGEPSIQPFGMTHLGGDTLLVAERYGRLRAITRAGGRTSLPDLDHTSNGLAFAELATADFALAISDSPDPVTAGEDLTYTLTLTNAGPADVVDATLYSDLPGTVDLVSAVPSQGACSVEPCGGLVCSLGDLAAGAGAAVTLEVTPLAAGRITLTARVPVVNDSDPADNEAAEATTVLPRAATATLLSVDRRSERLRVVDPATGAMVASRDITLAGETIEGADGLATHPVTGELWTLLRLSGQDGRELVTLDAVTGAATRVGDTGDRFDSLAFDASGTLYGITDRWAPTPEAIFVLSQTDATPSYFLQQADGQDGEALGFNPADGLLYHASGGLRFRSIDLSGPHVAGVADCTDLSFRAQALTHLGRDVLLLTGAPSVWRTDLYGITTDGGLTLIGDLGHYSTGLAFADIPRTDLSLTLSDSPDPVTAGEDLTYTLTLTNGGPADALDATVFADLPGTASLVSTIPTQGACGVRACGGLVCPLGDLAAGASASVTVGVTPLAAGSVVLTASVPAFLDPYPAGNRAAEATAVLAGASSPTLLSIDQGSDQLRVLDATTGATLASSAITLTGETILGGRGLATHPATGQLWALLRLSGQDGHELVTLDPATAVARRVGDTGDRFAGLAFDAGGTLYGITSLLAQAPETLFVLSQIDATPSFVISLADGGWDEAIAFHPADGLLYHASGGLTLESVDLSGPTVSQVVTCTLSQDFAAGAMTYLGRDVLLLADGRDQGLYGITTSGDLAHIGDLDHPSKGLALVDLPPADLSLTLSDAPDPVTVGENLSYTLTVTNSGPGDVLDVRVFDQPPGTASLVSALPTQGTCSVPACGELACSLGALAGGASATVSFDVTPLVAGSVVHTASVPALNDPEPADNEVAEVTTVLPRASSPTLLSIGGDTLREVDPHTGATLASTTVSLAGDRIWGGQGLATHPVTGELWAVLRLYGQDGHELVTIDPPTGVARRIGNTGWGFGGLAFDADGTLYGITDYGTWHYLFVLSQTDATPSYVLRLVLTGSGDTLAFDPADGLLYHAAAYRFVGGFTFQSIDLAGPTVAPIATCTLPDFQASALTYLGRDVLLLAGHHGGFYRLTTAGGLARLGSLDHRSNGLAFSLPHAAGPTTLYLPADSGRFEARVSYQTVQGGGRMGEARAIPLASLGIGKGGIFYFLDRGNPELLVKVLDGCAVNGHHWLFYAATTNVGFELTVVDTATGTVNTYANPDLNPAAPVLDTRAFATCEVD